MKDKRYTVLYPSEIWVPIGLFGAIILAQIIFYIRFYNNLNALRPPSKPTDLIPSAALLLLILFIVLYMALRRVTFSDTGVEYKHLKKCYSIAWEDVKYVKVTLNSNDKVGHGSFIVIATDNYALQYTDFRASREGFIVLRYRISALSTIIQHYNGEIFRASVDN